MNQKTKVKDQNVEQDGEKASREVPTGRLLTKPYFCKFQNLNQNLSFVQEYTNEFYKLSMRIEHQEDDE